jgi:hypothetical protein
MPLTRLRWAASTFGVSVAVSSKLSRSEASTIWLSPSVCIPTISALSLQSALMKCRKASSSRFFDASNRRWMAPCSASGSKSDSSACRAPVPPPPLPPDTERLPVPATARFVPAPPALDVST